MSKISPGAHTIEVAEPSPPSPTTAPFFPALLPASARVSIEWQDLTVSVLDAAAAAAAAKGGRRSRKTLVHPCSGAVAPGQLLAIMGPSGSGKTTLIDALAGRLQPGKVRGEVSLGGAPRPRDAAAAAEALSYVAQQDSLMGVFTARETLRHALRFAGGYGGGGGSAAHLTAREDEVLAQVGLTAVASTRVGDIFTKGLSGGQLRRLSLGVELVKKPAVLLLDEPTSGLDSASAYGVVAQLKLLAAAGHTVVCTIHQPSSEVWALFDRFLLLSQGRTLYFGGAPEAVQYFAALGHACPPFSNPADFFLGLVNTDFPVHNADVGALAASFACSGEAARLGQAVQAARGQLVAKGGGGGKGAARLARPSALAQFRTLSHRNLVNNARNPGIYWIRLLMYAALALLIGAMFHGLGGRFTPSSIGSRISLLFFVAAFLVFMSVAVLPFFISERGVFLRERMNGAYTVAPFVLANLVCSLPGLALIALVSSACVVPLAGLNGFGTFFLALAASLFAAEGFMSLVASLVPHYIIGIALGAGAFGFFMLCEGFFIVVDDIPAWFTWGHAIAFHTYAFRAFMKNEFEPIAAFDAGAPFASGAAVLESYGMAPGSTPSIGQDLCTVAMFGLLFHVLYGVVLHFKHTGKR